MRNGIRRVPSRRGGRLRGRADHSGLPSAMPCVDGKLSDTDEIGYLPMDIQDANLFFQLIARRYEKTSTVFASSKTFSQWNGVFADVTIASAILDRVLHHCTVINIKGES